MQFKLIDIQIGWDGAFFATSKGTVYYLFIVIIIGIIYAFSAFTYATQNPSLFIKEPEKQKSQVDNFLVYENFNTQPAVLFSPGCCVNNI